MIAAFSDAAGEAAWRAAVAKVLKGRAVDDLTSRTADGIAIAPLHPPMETRGPSGARPPLAVMARLDDALADAADELADGADGLVLVFEGAATARGFGLDLGGLDAALDGVDLAGVALRIDPAPFRGLDALHAVLSLARLRTIDPGSLDLDAGLDPLGAIARGAEAPAAWPAISGFIAEGATAIRDSGLTGPIFRASGRPHHEAGATEAQELAAVVAGGVGYLRAFDAAGLGLDAARASLSFLLVAEADEMLTIGKFRALRRLWARLEEACGLTPAPIRLHAETSWRMMTRRDPHTNILRTTLACAGAILGGAESATVLPFTAPLGLPDAAARRLARNTALVLRDEAGLDRVADPGAGSGAIEALTNALCAEAWELFQTIEAEGGMAAVLASGTWHAGLAAAQDRRRAALREGRRTIVGTTVFALAEEPPVAVLRPAPARSGALRDDELLEPDGVSA